jgi:hypothetical protein
MNFALITEGPSEHRVIKHIIAKYFKGQEVEINQIQPKIINEKQETVGGWNEVLKYCEREEVKDIFVENDYLVIQIDTDLSQTKPFSVSHTKQDAETKAIVNKTVEDLHADVVEKLQSLIRPEILAVYGDKILFAICVHTIECWLLPLHFADHHRSSTSNCLAILNTSLRKQDINQIPTKNKNSPQSIRTYETILRDWRKKADIVQSAKYNPAFQKFVDSLGNIPFPSGIGDY